eukprot:1846341-Amphidinium_carterae.1
MTVTSKPPTTLSDLARKPWKRYVQGSIGKRTKPAPRQVSPKPHADTETGLDASKNAEAEVAATCETSEPGRTTPRTSEQGKTTPRSPSPHVPPATAEQAERLHRVILEATAALRGLLGVPQSDDEGSEPTTTSEAEPIVRRSKSEPLREVKPMPGALRSLRERRHSRDGKPLRVSFSRDGSVSDLCSDTDSFKVAQGDSVVAEPEPDPGDTQANSLADSKSETDSIAGEDQVAQFQSETMPSTAPGKKKKPSRQRRHG